ncbi:MAG: hypothetical protein WAN43_00340 [Rhodomicrobium sp.]
MTGIDDISPEKLKEAAASLFKLRDDAVAEMLGYKDSLPKEPTSEQKQHLARLNGIIVGLAKATFEFDKHSARPERKQLTMRERWAREEEMYRNGEISLFGLSKPKTNAKPTPEPQPENAISPKTDTPLSKLKVKRSQR